MDVTETEEIIVHNLPSQKPQAPKQPHNLAVAFNVNMNATISSTNNNRTKWNISFFVRISITSKSSVTMA